MRVLLKWIINGVAIAVSAVIIPAVSFHGPVGPLLSLVMLSILVSWVSPKLIDADKEFLFVEFFFLNYIFTVPLFVIALAATPQLESSGFLPPLLITLVSAMVNTLLQFHFDKKYPDEAPEIKKEAHVTPSGMDIPTDDGM